MTQITPFELWQDFRAWVNTQQGGFMPPQSVFVRVANIASLELWKNKTRNAEKSQEIRDDLLPFLVSQNIILKQADSYYSILTPPANYGRFATAKILVTKSKDKEQCTVPSKEINKGKCFNGKKNIPFVPEKDLEEDYYNNTKEYDVELVDNQKWSGMLKHLNKYPTFKKPKMTQINGGFKVAPRGVSVVVLNYYLEPTDAVFGYAPVAGNVLTGSGGAIQYNPLTSKNFQWSKTVKPELLEEIKRVYISYTQNGLLQQITSAQKPAV